MAMAHGEAPRPAPHLPRGVELAWGLTEPPTRGPRRGLSIERIVDAAVAIADEQGLAAVSMSSVAKSLGFTTMSLYRYVSAKDDLVVLMLDRGLGRPPESVRRARTWRNGLRRLCEAERALYRRHPWLLDIPITGLPSTPNNLAWVDAGLHVLRNTGLAAAEQLAAVLLTTGQVRFQATVERSYESVAATSGQTVEDFDEAEASAIDSLVTAEAYPDLHRAAAAGAFRAVDDPFDWMLETALDGLAARIEAAAP